MKQVEVDALLVVLEASYAVGKAEIEQKIANLYSELDGLEDEIRVVKSGIRMHRVEIEKAKAEYLAEKVRIIGKLDISERDGKVE